LPAAYAGEAVTSTRRWSVPSDEEREFHGRVSRRHPSLEHHAFDRVKVKQLHTFLERQLRRIFYD
jgi:hypothetical protein